MSERRSAAQDQTVDEVVDMLAANLPRALIALDFDGTLAPIVSDPSQSRLITGAADVLTTLAGRGARVALISGRDASTVVALSGLGGLPEIIVEGLYGAERWYAGQLTTLPTPASLDGLREELHSIVVGSPSSQLWIEDKRLSLVVHARRALDPSAALGAIDRSIRLLAQSRGLEIHPGRDVVEVRLPGFDKGGALRRVVADSGRTLVLFAGDDVGDVPAFGTIAGLRDEGFSAWGIVVSSPEVPGLIDHGDLAVAGPGALIELLVRIAGKSDRSA